MKWLCGSGQVDLNLRTRGRELGCRPWSLYPLGLVLLLTLGAGDGVASERFKQGDLHVSASGGGGPGGFGLGAEVGYYLVDGLEVSLGAGYWSFEETGLFRVTPGARYVVDLDSIMPYVGTFYRRWLFTDDRFDDLFSIGGRVGSFFFAGRGMLIGIGVAHEVLMDCDSAQVGDCELTYPEFSFALQL